MRIFKRSHTMPAVTWPQANLYGLFVFPIGRIYTNVSASINTFRECLRVANAVKAIMDTLNVRASLRSEIAEVDEVLDVSRTSWKPFC